MTSVNVNYSEEILGAVAKQNLVHGRMVKLVANPTSYNYGGRQDLPGVAYPTSTAEAALSKYVVLFADDNRSLPVYEPGVSFTFALRGGFDQAANSPMTSQTVYAMHPKDYEVPQTIPSGAVCRAYGEGIFTIPSGSFVHSSSLEVPSAQLTVEHTGSDQGKLKYGTSNVVAEVVKFNADASLTFRIS